MQAPDVQRKLMAIMAGDMVGYSRLMEIDEDGTFARLKAHRLELVDPAIAKYKGRIIKSTGDGILVEFASAAEAVQCALEIQRRMIRRNCDVAADRRIQFRIGINLGDVIIESGDVFGDGVNIAARLEQLAEPDGITVSQAVRDQMTSRFDILFDDLGDQHVKNINRPIRTFRVVIGDGGTTPADSPGAQQSAPKESPVEHLSIAVLPFINMSGDADQEFFADGLTEDIITELSRFRDLLVISRNSTFVFKGRAVNVQEVARELGVHYVVEGSVRKAGNRVRITVQLIDALSDRHVWAERYDRDLSDIFEIQDEVTSSIVSTLPGRVEAAAHDRAKRKTTDNMDAYERVLAAKVLHHRSNREDNAAAQTMISSAISLDPNYAHAHAWRACILGQACVHAWPEDIQATWNEAFREVEIAMSLDDADADVQRLLAAVGLAQNDFDAVRQHQQRGLALNPNYDLLVVQQGEYLTWIGQPEEGIEWIRKAMRLNPHHPERFWGHLARAYFVARRYEEAIEALRRMAKPDKFSQALLAAAHAQLGNQTEAAAGVRAVLAADPDFGVSTVRETLHYKHEADLEHCLDAMRKAGLPA
jgi:adenylate cyclase